MQYSKIKTLVLYGYGSKKGYGSLRGDPDVWNEGDTQMISNEFYLFKRVWIRGMDCLWVRGMDRDLTF
jgi:hypothetical protein